MIVQIFLNFASSETARHAEMHPRTVLLPGKRKTRPALACKGGTGPARILVTIPASIIAPGRIAPVFARRPRAALRLLNFEVHAGIVLDTHDAEKRADSFRRRALASYHLAHIERVHPKGKKHSHLVHLAIHLYIIRVIH